MPLNTRFKSNHLHTYTLTHLHTKKGVALIIVIFAMMLFAILGWTLANLQSGGFEIHLDTLNSEQALGIAEAGTQWALQQLTLNSSFRTAATTHTFSPGAYNISCLDGTGLETGKIVIISTGYIPSQANYRSLRTVKAAITLGSFDKVVQVKNLFNWTQAQPFPVTIDGDIEALYYNADGDANYNEGGVDYNNAPPLLPPGNSGSRTAGSSLYPSINMTYYEQEASVNGTVWPNPSTRVLTAAVNSGLTSGTNLWVNQNGFFTGMANHAVRNLNLNTWNDASPYGWSQITSVPPSDSGRHAVLERNVGETWDGATIKIVRRYTGNTMNQNLHFVKSDALLDARSGNVRFQRTGLVAEGDIALKGTNTVDFSDRPESYPSLATQAGNITSLDTPAGGSDSAKRNRRTFDSLIYTENGTVTFNYLQGTSVMGSNAIFQGSIELDYESDVTAIIGYISNSSKLTWQEQ